MPSFRRGNAGYDKEKEDGEEEAQSLLGGDTISMSNLYKKTEDFRSTTKSQSPDQTIQCDIQPTDTLLSLSLKYNVPLAELKRVNNILTDQGFYALKRIKIPVRPHSLLLPDVHHRRSSNNNGWVVESKESPTDMSSNLSSRVSTGYSSPYSELGDEGGREGVEEQHPLIFHESKDKKKVKRLLKDMDKDLDRIREKQSELEQTVVEENSITIKEPHPIKFPLRDTQIPSEDPGCSNRVLGCWCLLVSILIVIVFFVLVQLMGFERDITHDGWNKTEPTKAALKPQVNSS